MNPFARITAKCYICGAEEEDRVVILIKKGWKISGNHTKCPDCKKKK